MKSRFMYVALVSLIALTLLASCGAKAAPKLSIEGAWGKPSMMYPTAGAMYMVIKNAGDAPDTLVSGSSEACGSIEVHKTVMKDDGTMGMDLIDKPLEIPAGGQATLESGGIHIMCIMKTDKFAPGTTVNLTLKFEKSGEMTIPVELRME